MKTISIVVPCYNEEENVQQEALFAAIEQKDYKKAYDTAKELVEFLFEPIAMRSFL